MDDQYKVSIIIPHYNTPDLLKKLLSTIPDNKEIQTIVVDDHSDEDSRAKVRELETLYADRPMLFLDNTSAHNAGTARNIGLKYAQGKWLMFADADDYFLPGFYEGIKKYFDTGYDMIFFQPISCRLDTGEVGKRHLDYAGYINDYFNKPCVKTEAILRYKWAASWSKLIRASVVKEHNIRFESIKYSNDNVFSAQIGLFAKEIAVSKETIYCVVYRDGSLTTDMDITSFDIRTWAKIRKFRFLKTHLTKEELHDCDAYQLAIAQLLIILRRGYGLRCFTKYLKLFQKNQMLIFDIRMFNPVYFLQWLSECRKEREIVRSQTSSVE